MNCYWYSGQVPVPLALVLTVLEIVSLRWSKASIDQVALEMLNAIRCIKNLLMTL